jgi:D-alanine-D-alanine ligase
MKSLRVLVMLHPQLQPPEQLETFTEKQIEEWRVEYDVISQLRAAGHEVRVQPVLDTLAALDETLRRWRPQVVFNLLEEFAGVVAYEAHLVAHLELMQQRYTGCNPRGLMLARDKVLAKRLLASAGIATPAWCVAPRGALPVLPASLRYPLIVKSASEDASLGIAQASVVRDRTELRERVRLMHRRHDSDALIEEYIEGRELYVGVLGNRRPRVLPVWELQFGRLPPRMSRIATRRIKWDRAYQRSLGIGPRPAADLDAANTRRIQRVALAAFRALQLSGVARIDFRQREDGSLFVLEANPNPNLARVEDLATSAAAAGLDYAQLLGLLLRNALRQRAAWHA